MALSHWVNSIYSEPPTHTHTRQLFWVAQTTADTWSYPFKKLFSGRNKICICLAYAPSPLGFILTAPIRSEKKSDKPVSQRAWLRMPLLHVITQNKKRIQAAPQTPGQAESLRAGKKMKKKRSPQNAISVKEDIKYWSREKLVNKPRFGWRPTAAKSDAADHRIRTSSSGMKTRRHEMNGAYFLPCEAVCSLS